MSRFMDAPWRPCGDCNRYLSVSVPIRVLNQSARKISSQKSRFRVLPSISFSPVVTNGLAAAVVGVHPTTGGRPVSER